MTTDAELIEKVRIFAAYEPVDKNPDYQQGYKDCLLDLYDLINVPDA